MRIVGQIIHELEKIELYYIVCINIYLNEASNYNTRALQPLLQNQRGWGDTAPLNGETVGGKEFMGNKRMSCCSRKTYDF